MTRDEARARGRAMRWAGHIDACLEDYQFIGGRVPSPDTWTAGFNQFTPLPYGASARQLAERLGVSPRTIVRWRQRLRQEAV